MKVPATALGPQDAQSDRLGPSDILRTPGFEGTPTSSDVAHDGPPSASRERRGSGRAGWKVLIPNAVTLANITFGFLGILAAAEGRFERSVMWLFAGAMCDLMDGRLARLLRATSTFGKELDSLSDMVSFGVAPAVLVYLAALSRLGAVGLAVAALLPLAGAIRLARYNIDTKDLAQVTFEGLPIPIAASYVWSFVIVREALPVWMIGAGVALTAALMVSTLKIPKFRRGGLPVPLMFVGLATFMVFLAHPTALTWHVWNGFNVLAVAFNYALLSKRRLLPGRPS